MFTKSAPKYYKAQAEPTSQGKYFVAILFDNDKYFCGYVHGDVLIFRTNLLFVNNIASALGGSILFINHIHAIVSGKEFQWSYCEGYRHVERYKTIVKPNRVHIRYNVAYMLFILYSMFSYRFLISHVTACMQRRFLNCKCIYLKGYNISTLQNEMFHDRFPVLEGRVVDILHQG